MLEKVQAALAAIEAPGSFAVELACPSGELAIEVEGVGALRLPLSATAARALVTVARRAPFGRKDQTLHDLGVRDTWEIGARKIKIDARAWKRTLDPALLRIRDALGVPPDCELVAVLDKMLVYEPGQFFVAHQDSERDDDMLGTLVVTLPSKWSGGTFVVQHRGQKKVFRGAKRGPKDLSLLAFYADCHHEVRPVESGHRVVLTYHLLRRAAAKAKASAPVSRVAPAVLDELAAHVEAHFATGIPPRYGNDPPELPDRLVYLLDHEYTEKSLAWTRRKNGDRERGLALRQVAERLDCECWLALADVHESWTCEDEDWGYRSRGRRRRYRDDDADDIERGEPELLELNDSDVELRHWVGDARGGAPERPVHPSSREICFTKESAELEPFKSEHEGYRGNYGNTMDRWYHRAAVVLWPRSREFVIKARHAPSYAVDELAARIAARDLTGAREGARSLLPFWAGSLHSAEKPRFFPKLLRVVLQLDDAELAHALLAPFGPERLGARAAQAFAQLVERYGLAWAQRVFASWAERRLYQHREEPWLPLLPELFRALLVRAPTHGRALATWLLGRELSVFEKARRDALRRPRIWLGGDEAGKHAEPLRALFEAAAVIDAASSRDRLVALVTSGETALHALAAGAVLERCLEDRAPAEVRALGLSALFLSVVDALERTAVAESRAPGDWSIEVPLLCRCRECAELDAFLRDPRRVTHTWPLAEERRRHVHQAIDRHRPPVRHVTTRSGRPYSLVLTKREELFAREEAWRARHRDVLGRLRAQRAAFVERGGR